MLEGVCISALCICCEWSGSARTEWDHESARVAALCSRPLTANRSARCVVVRVCGVVAWCPLGEHLSVARSESHRGQNDRVECVALRH